MPKGADKKQSEMLKKDLASALKKLEVLGELITICSSCNKKVKIGNGHWFLLEEHISKYTDALLSHGICPECAEKTLEDFKKYAKENGITVKE